MTNTIQLPFSLEGSFSMTLDDATGVIKVMVRNVATGNPTGFARKVAGWFGSKYKLEPVPDTVLVNCELEKCLPEKDLDSARTNLRAYAQSVKDSFDYHLGITDRFSI